MRSLRQRAIIGAVVWAIVIATIGGLALIALFDSLTQRRFDEVLLERHRQIIVALATNGPDQDAINASLGNPAYFRPYSGLYWQAVAEDGTTLVSRSLFDNVLAPPETGHPGALFWEGEGPGEQVRGLVQRIVAEDGLAWDVTVAQSLADYRADRARIRQSLIATFALVGVLGIAGAVLQISIVVRPLTKLRKDVARRWENVEDLDPDGYPEEVAPLVADINMLLSRNREIIDRARRRAADLAHALKTPTAVLRNELSALEAQGADVVQARDALAKVDEQITRSLARIRAANTAGKAAAQADVAASVERMARLFRSMPVAEGKKLEVAPGAHLMVAMDRQDLEEVLGNILENAFKWARKKVRVTFSKHGTHARVVIEDDGPGIAEGDRREAVRSGRRLDTSVPGTGLGLAIASDLLQACGGNMELGVSKDLGGLKVSLTIPLTAS